MLVSASCLLVVIVNAYFYYLKTTFFTVKTSNEVYCCRIYFVNYIQNVHIINRTLHGSLEDMDFMFSWQEQYLTRSLRSLVRYCSCHSNIKSISSRNRVISYIYTRAVYCTVSVTVSQFFHTGIV